MAGHSQFANIKYRKERQDAAKGKVFSKISKEITVAIKQGGGTDPNANTRLAAAIVRAKEVNMPNDNIERAIKRATGELPGMAFEEITYEGYGPEGVAVMLHVITDNRNRTAAEIRHLFEHAGGSLGGSVAWMFHRRGLVGVSKGKLEDPESFMLEVLDWGADDVQETKDSLQIYCDPSQLSQLVTHIKKAGVEPDQAQVTMVPQNTVKLEDKPAERMLRFMQALDDHEDVQDVYANFEVSDEALQAVQ